MKRFNPVEFDLVQISTPHVHKVNGAFTWRTALDPGWNFAPGWSQPSPQGEGWNQPGSRKSYKRASVRISRQVWTALQMQISRERIHVTIQDCRSGLLAAYQYLTRVNCLHVNAHLFCLSYRLSTRAELNPGWNFSCKHSLSSQIRDIFDRLGIREISGVKY